MQSLENGKCKFMPVKIELFVSNSCPHCPAAKEVVQEVCSKFKGVIVEEVDTSKPDGVARATKYQIYAVPTVVINEKITIVGVPNKDELANKIEAELKKC